MTEQYTPDFTIVNIENATSGRWPVCEHAEFFERMWVDVMTWGDHIFDNTPNINTYFAKENCRLIRPANFYEHKDYKLPWKWYTIVEKDGKRILVIQLLWEVFMSHKVDNPFQKIHEIIETISPEKYDALIVDFHRETTAELYGMGNFLDGKASVVYGTHTHIQTNDAHILPNGTGIISDVGMNGPFESVIGAKYDSVEKRFLTGIQRGKIEQQTKWKYIINALYAEIDGTTKMCTHIENISYTWNL